MSILKELRRKSSHPPVGRNVRIKGDLVREQDVQSTVYDQAPETFGRKVEREEASVGGGSVGAVRRRRRSGRSRWHLRLPCFPKILGRVDAEKRSEKARKQNDGTKGKKDVSTVEVSSPRTRDRP